MIFLSHLHLLLVLSSLLLLAARLRRPFRTRACRIPCLGGGARRQQELRLRAAVLRISDAAVHAEGERGRQFAKVISWSLDSEIL